MKICTKCKEDRELTEFSKSKILKDGLNIWCKPCHKAYRLANKEKMAIKKSINYQKNKKDIYVKRVKYVYEHKIQVSTYMSEYYDKNREDLRIKQAEYSAVHKEDKSLYDISYREANRDKRNATNAKRRAAKLQRVLRGLTSEHIEDIKAFYVEAARLTRETGIQHHVDHIIPLQGKNVSGLHVPWNLQILTASENSSKGNRVLS